MSYSVITIEGVGEVVGVGVGGEGHDGDSHNGYGTRHGDGEGAGSSVGKYKGAVHGHIHGTGYTFNGGGFIDYLISFPSGAAQFEVFLAGGEHHGEACHKGH